MMVNIILAAIFLIATIIFAHKKFPQAWVVFSLLSAAMAITGIWVHLTTSWLIAVIVVWTIVAIIVLLARSIYVKTAFVAITAMVLAIVLSIIFTYYPSNKKVDTSASTSTSESSSSAATIASTANSAWTLQQVRTYLKANNWPEGSYTFNIDPKKDVETNGGAGSFGTAKTSDELVAFLKAGTAPAVTALNDMISNGYIKDELLDASNWVAVQSVNKGVKYPGNTSYKNGKVIAANSIKDGPGSIFFVYVPPQNSSSASVSSSTSASSGKSKNMSPTSLRSGCLNTQRHAPIPAPATVTPTPSSSVPSSSTPVSSTPSVPLPNTDSHHHHHHNSSSTPAPKAAWADPAARGNAPVGGGKNADPGPGTYVPPYKMEQPPTSSRVNPKPPTSSSKSSSSTSTQAASTAPTPTPDPTPAPKPESAAPTPSSPASGHAVVPGIG